MLPVAIDELESQKIQKVWYICGEEFEYKSRKFQQNERLLPI